jgi:hypothetical protein
MTTFLLIIIVLLGIALAVVYYLKQLAENRATSAEKQAADVLTKTNASLLAMQQAFESKLSLLDTEANRIREHYEAEALKAHESSHALLAQTLAELESLRVYSTLKDAETEVRKTLADALDEVNALREEAQALIERARNEATEESSKAQQRVDELRSQAEALLAQATRDAGRIVADAERRAEQIGGDAYIALRDKQLLEHAAMAIRNTIDGYGDRYVIPTHSLLDDLASDFGHTAAGESLRAARENTRRMVADGEAASCDYAESNRRQTAIRFVIDAFNGRVDAMLSTVRHNNYGTLEQEVRDAFSLVNLNGEAFRNARILPSYLDARLAELKWAVIVQELKLKEREEQRRIQEQIREEEKARREYERAIQEAAREEAAIKRAMEKARDEVQHANAQEREKLEVQLAELNQRLVETEAKNQRALSMAQQTRSGHIYVISNIGSFGEEVFKIGMTRRLEPMDRIWELGDASVPFDFDVHAMIYSEDAPALERLLHQSFDDLRINKVNYRKEFFRLPLERIRALTTERGLEATFTMVAEAREFRETLALEKMTPEERDRYRLHESDNLLVPAQCPT